MHVFLTGATGFVGSYVLPALKAAGHTVRCLARDPKALVGQDVEAVKGNILDPRSLQGLMRGCDAVVHLVGIIEEHPSKGITFDAIHYDGSRHVIDTARQEGIKQFVHMSANGARPDGVSAYQTSKWKAEEYLKKAGFEQWTIFRPSVIFGDPGPDNPEFASQLANTLIKPFPILPVFGDGLYEMQPISVEEVAAAFAQALTNEAAWGKTYIAAGQESFPYTEVLDRIARGLGISPKPQVKQPLWLIRPVVNTAGRAGLLPISPDQFEMLLEGNTGDSRPFYKDFDLTFKPFNPDNLAYLK